MAFTSDAGSAAERLLKNRVALSPVARAKSKVKTPTLPRIEAPALEELFVEVPTEAVPAVTDAAVAGRLARLEAEFSTFVPVPAPERIERGHEVLLDLAAIEAGSVVPGTVRENLELRVEEGAFLPGFAMQLVGRRAKDECTLSVTLPKDGPDPRYAGRTLQCKVWIKAARRRVPVKLSDPSVLAEVAPGLTVEELTARVREDLFAERAQALHQLAVEKVLDALLEECEPFEVPEAFVEYQIRRLWFASEGDALVRLGYSPIEQQHSLATFLADPVFRAEAERKVQINVVFLALIEEAGIGLERADLDAAIEYLAGAHGLDAEAMKNDLPTHLPEAMQLGELVLHDKCVKHLLEHVPIAFV